MAALLREGLRGAALSCSPQPGLCLEKPKEEDEEEK